MYAHHPKGVSQACSGIGNERAGVGFNRVQGSRSTGHSEGIATLFGALIPLEALPRLRACIRDLRALGVGQWSDFTQLVKS